MEASGNHGFIFEPTSPEHWVFGQGKATQRFGSQPLLLDGHGWQKYKPSEERQDKNNLETYACTVFATLNAYETLARFSGFKDFPSNCSDRFNAIMAGITPPGGSIQATAESIRKYGVVTETALPFSSSIYDWNQYYSPDPMDPALLALGKSITDKFTLGHEYVFNGVVSGKPQLLIDALERGTVCVSVYAWRQDAQGLYYKNATDVDEHYVLLLDYVENEYWIVFDQYFPFVKKVAWGTDFQTAKVHFLSRRDLQQEVTMLTLLLSLYQKLLALQGQLKQKLGFRV